MPQQESRPCGTNCDEVVEVVTDPAHVESNALPRHRQAEHHCEDKGREMRIREIVHVVDKHRYVIRLNGSGDPKSEAIFSDFGGGRGAPRGNERRDRDRPYEERGKERCEDEPACPNDVPESFLRLFSLAAFTNIVIPRSKI